MFRCQLVSPSQSHIVVFLVVMFVVVVVVTALVVAVDIVVLALSEVINDV